VQVDPIKPTLKPPGSERLKLKCDDPLPSFAFDFNVRRYITVQRDALSDEMKQLVARVQEVGPDENYSPRDPPHCESPMLPN
jgi:hypothetical protein